MIPQVFYQMNNFAEPPRIVDKDEKWFRWEPAGIELANNYYLESFNYEDGLKIILKEQGGGQTLQVLFDGQILSMRFADETMRLKLFDDLYNKYGK